MKNGASSKWVEPHRGPKRDLFEGDNGPDWSEYEHYKNLDTRRLSYDHPDWPSDVPLAPEALARAGWFYIGREDRVQCPWCGGCVFNWVPGDSALGEHRRHFPHCEFVQEHIANALTPVKPSEASSKPRKKPDVTSQNWRDSEAVKAARDLELPDDVIEKAARSLLRKKGKRIANVVHARNWAKTENSENLYYCEFSDEINADNLLEAVFRIMDNADNKENGKKGNETGTTSSEGESLDGNPQAQAARPRRKKKPKAKPSEGCKDEESDITLMQKKTEEYRQNITCKICLEEKVGVLFLPCRHLICCKQCADNVHKCPLCREKIIGTILAFI